MLVTSKMTTPLSSCQTSISGWASDCPGRQGRHLFQHGARRRGRGAAEGQRDVVGVVGAEPVEVLGFHGAEVIGQEVDGGRSARGITVPFPLVMKGLGWPTQLEREARRWRW